MNLSTEQQNFFATFGYLALPQLFTSDETTWITAEFEKVLNTRGNGEQHDGSERTMIVPTIDHSERLCTLLDDERIVGIARDILGADFNYASGDGNYYSGDTGWHPDGSYPELFAIKMASWPTARIRSCESTPLSRREPLTIPTPIPTAAARGLSRGPKNGTIPTRAASAAPSASLSVLNRSSGIRDVPLALVISKIHSGSSTPR